MIKYEIKEKDGYLDMIDLPHNCIFNKVRTGCGGTTIALRNEENYIIAVPTTELIVNKLNSTENLFGLYGDFTSTLKDGLISYTQRDGVKKIMCTYDKLPKLVELIYTTDYRLLVDEYHNLLKQYMFRSTAINGVLDNFREFKSFCFMSATSIDVELKPDVLRDVPEYYADWSEGTLTQTVAAEQAHNTNHHQGGAHTAPKFVQGFQTAQNGQDKTQQQPNDAKNNFLSSHIIPPQK